MKRFEIFERQEDLLERIDALRQEGYNNTSFEVYSAQELTDRTEEFYNIKHRDAEPSLGDKIAAFFTSENPEERVFNQYDWNEATERQAVEALDNGNYILIIDEDEFTIESDEEAEERREHTFTVGEDIDLDRDRDVARDDAYVVQEDKYVVEEHPDVVDEGVDVSEPGDFEERFEEGRFHEAERLDYDGTRVNPTLGVDNVDPLARRTNGSAVDPEPFVDPVDEVERVERVDYEDEVDHVENVEDYPVEDEVYYDEELIEYPEEDMDGRPRREEEQTFHTDPLADERDERR